VIRIVLKSGASVDVDGTWSEASDPIVPGSRLRAKQAHIITAPDATRLLIHLNWEEVAAIVELPG
jgi:hypothetical protein